MRPIILLFSGWITKTVIFNHDDLVLACKWVSEQDFWKEAMYEIEAFGAHLEDSRFSDVDASCIISGDNGVVEVRLHDYSKILEV